MTDQDKLRQVRDRIDALDTDILRLVNERGRLAQDVARIKREAGEQADFYRPEREQQVLRRLQGLNQGPLSDETVTRLFREIMSACLALQQPLRIGFLGPEGTFTQAAAIKQFGHEVQLQPLASIDTVFKEVESGDMHYGVVPVENSTEGVVNHTLDCFLNSPLQIVGEVELRIQHHLVSREPSAKTIKRVYSHPQGLAQCRTWLDVNLPTAERVTVSSTAEAARLAASETSAAAIASEAAAEMYDLHLLVEGIEDNSGNTTRFLVIGRQSPPPTGDDKTSLVVSRIDQPGGLVRLLQPLSDHGINMTRLDARPSKQGVWEYAFFIDLLGHADDDRVRGALDAMREQASLFRVLGSYPRVAR
ncbi:chorismate mutase/prephenate dehydratase [Natronocella acetinitrilica]|uniref:Bifunctional chorismate mutase/prephenate dehydratase n=1 Tax=Natronocella acetinitrilica TaxID=414046 RepID=A0AAE3KG42_9GAMM|nr:prephenate dehydratase [Natronocella acetinitrilica]MCP1674797.1 chorismate mutase/prephenate dehydratase [Natronocella acetinitrilica]